MGDLDGNDDDRAVRIRRVKETATTSRSSQRGRSELWEGQPAAIYCRISHVSDEDQTGVDRQERICRDVAQRLGLRVTQDLVFVDNNRSAWKRDRVRKGWNALLEAARTGAVRHIVAYHPDRLMRQPKDLEELLTIADDADITLHGQANRRELSDPDDRFFLRIEVAHACRSAGLLVVQRGRATTVRPSIASTPDAHLAFDPAIIRGRKKNGSSFRTWEAQGWTDVEEPSRYRTETAAHAQALQLAPGEPLFVLDRQLQHADSGAEITHRIYLPFATVSDVPALEEDPFRQPAELYQVLTDTGRVLRWNDSITTAMPSPDEAATLDIPDGVPLLIHTRITLTTDDGPLMLEETHLPGHRTRIISAPSVSL